MRPYFNFALKDLSTYVLAIAFDAYVWDSLPICVEDKVRELITLGACT
jgi:hypothetical protein